MTKKEFYQPGVCNLNQPEVAYRRNAAYVLSVIALAVIAGLWMFDAPAVLLAIVSFVPVFLAALNFLQARNKFCVMYASQGVYNPTEEYAKVKQVSDSKHKAADKAKANSMYIQAGVIAAVISLLLFFVKAAL